MHLRDPKHNYMTGMRDLMLRDDFREASIKFEIVMLRG